MLPINPKAILIYPKYPETFWSFKYVLKLIGKKAPYPPLGLLTVGASLPNNWQKKLIDMNVENLNDEDLKWADYVFISAMIVQKESVREIIKRSKKLNKKIVAGGPLFTTSYRDFEEIDYFVLGESEVALPSFLEDLKKGCPKHIYKNKERADLRKTPIPLWSLIDMKKYALMNIQYSRGCPFNCEFCEITLFLGRIQRTKEKEHILRELDALYDHGWKEGVFFVDDNFIGNKEKLKKEILPTLIKWQKEKRYPFNFSTQVSVNLADDDELIDLMARAGFGTVFLGVETPDEDSLTECGKFQNKNRDLVSCIKKIQRKGMEVQGGFIVGFDHDLPSIFERQIQFIQKSGIVMAMVGILGALRDTRLYLRLKKEKRLLKEVSGDNTDCSVNFVPKMGRETLITGYKKIIHTIYSPRHYYQRVINFLEEYQPSIKKKIYFHFYHLKVFFQSIWLFGIKERGRIHFWRLMFWTLIKRPQFLHLALGFAVRGHHFRQIFKKYA